jgi:hypothetical protein
MAAVRETKSGKEISGLEREIVGLSYHGSRYKEKE